MRNEQVVKEGSSIKESEIEQKDDSSSKENEPEGKLKETDNQINKNVSGSNIFTKCMTYLPHLISRLLFLESAPINNSTKDSLDKQNSLKKIEALCSNHAFKSKGFRKAGGMLILLVLSLSVISFSWIYNHGENKNLRIFVCNYVIRGIKFKKMYNNSLGKRELEIIFNKKLNSVTKNKLVKCLLTIKGPVS